MISGTFNVNIKKWEQNNNYFARIRFFNTDKEHEYIIKSNSKDEFNKKIYSILKNYLVLKN